MFNYWEGAMDWLLEDDWKCEICGERGLIWGIVHAHCRCMTCHTEYNMKDKERKRVAKPICCLKEEYYEAVKKAWEELKKPISEISMEELEKFRGESQLPKAYPQP